MDTLDDYHSCPFQEYLPRDSDCMLCLLISTYCMVPKIFNLLGISRCQPALEVSLDIKNDVFLFVVC